MQEKDKVETVTSDEREEKEVIGYRKSCDAEGTGLSHFILMDKDAQ